jgi:hypothetical protein
MPSITVAATLSPRRNECSLSESSIIAGHFLHNWCFDQGPTFRGQSNCGRKTLSCYGPVPL